MEELIRQIAQVIGKLSPESSIRHHRDTDELEIQNLGLITVVDTKSPARRPTLLVAASARARGALKQYNFDPNDYGDLVLMANSALLYMENPDEYTELFPP